MCVLKTLTYVTLIITLRVMSTRCKPLQQNSNDRDYSDDDDDVVDDPILSASLEKLKKATEGLNELRRMFDERTLIASAKSGGKAVENFKYSGALPSRRRTEDVDGITSSNSKRAEHSRRRQRHKSQQRKQQQQQQQDQQLYQRDVDADLVNVAADAGQTGGDDEANANNVRGGSLAQAFKINANLYRSPVENTQALLANGRETEARFNNIATGLFASPLECPRMHGKVTQLLCPTRRRHGYHVCIDETALCNGKTECPNGEDEDPVNCMFYKTTMRYFKTVVDQVVQLSDHVLRAHRHANEEL